MEGCGSGLGFPPHGGWKAAVEARLLPFLGGHIAARRAFWQARYQAAAPMIDRAVERGELDTHADPRLVLEILIAPMHFRLLSTREPLSADFLTGLVDFVMRALASSPPAAAIGLHSTGQTATNADGC